MRLIFIIIIILFNIINIITAATETQLSGLSDAQFGTITNFSQDQTINTQLCIYTTQSTAYRVTVHGLHDNTLFNMQNNQDSNYHLAYLIFLNDQALSPQVSHILINNLSKNFKDNIACSEGMNTILKIIVPASSLGRTVAGNYSDMLTILIEPV